MALFAAPAAVKLARFTRPKPQAIERLSFITVDSGGGADFTTLREALKHAAPGVTIFLRAGHSEVVREPLTLPRGARVRGA